MIEQIGQKIKILQIEGMPEATGRKGFITSIDEDLGAMCGTWGDFEVFIDDDWYIILLDE